MMSGPSFSFFLFVVLLQFNSSNRGWYLQISINACMLLRDMRHVCKNSASFVQDKSSESKNLCHKDTLLCSYGAYETGIDIAYCLHFAAFYKQSGTESLSSYLVLRHRLHLMKRGITFSTSRRALQDFWCKFFVWKCTPLWIRWT